MEHKWISKWPTKAGKYWFYGWAYGNQIDWDKKPVKPELNYVNVLKISNGVAVVREGNFWFEHEKWIGKFQKINEPDIPDILEMMPKQEIVVDNN